jgi:hypothetical protein
MFSCLPVMELSFTLLPMTEQLGSELVDKEEEVVVLDGAATQDPLQFPSHCDLLA